MISFSASMIVDAPSTNFIFNGFMLLLPLL
jgi:hypothetical protein